MFVKICATGRRRGSPHKVYIFLISINSRVDIAISACPSACPFHFVSPRYQRL